eukprot:CAMPEP_0117549566 /NCGR_PEP_ID=MMETSP0784-20121206/48232_1 /TAXON_ID=39447 /ORGANISM="" /LENGTH=272 /DNA_ID=CAMNT_0005346559 /DNA_START=302 /DNA_END=1116 /DNA_ORIENTATION=+
MPQVLHVGAVVARPVRPFHDAHAVHVAIEPLAGVVATVCEIVRAMPFHFIVMELTRVQRLALDRIGAVAMLAASHKLAPVFGAIGPALHTLAILVVLIPLPFVHATILVDTPPAPVGSVLVPLALVCVPTRRYELAKPVGLAVGESSLVVGSILRSEKTIAVKPRALPLALVPGTALQDNFGLLRQLSVMRGIAIHHVFPRRWKNSVLCVAGLVVSDWLACMALGHATFCAGETLQKPSHRSWEPTTSATNDLPGRGRDASPPRRSAAVRSL